MSDFVMQHNILKQYTGPGGDVVIPDGVTTIGVNAFRWCKTVTSVTIPDSVTHISMGAFEGCSALERLTIPDSVTQIDNQAFHWCERLAEVTIPGSVSVIGDEMGAEAIGVSFQANHFGNQVWIDMSFFTACSKKACGEENGISFQKTNHASMAFKWLIAGLAYITSM